MSAPTSGGERVPKEIAIAATSAQLAKNSPTTNRPTAIGFIISLTSTASSYFGRRQLRMNA
jgi:hypothetical protein